MIVDSAVTRSTWVVEPFVKVAVPVDEDALAAFFTEGLPKALPGWEARPQQLEMARHVARALDEDRPLLCEAGTGTGKSLAYLVPAALWARANDTKVAVEHVHPRAPGSARARATCRCSPPAAST